MKELTIEQKAKRYDAAIEELRNAFYNDKSRMCEEYRQAVIKVIEPIFPELKESEDEEIRKGLIELVKQSSEILDKRNQEQMIVWLEKQDKNRIRNKYIFNSIPRLLEMIKPTDRAKSYCQKLIDSLLQEGYITDANIVSNCLKQMNDEKVAMATMDEQDLNDIKPKFKVGDYVVGKYISGYITEIRDDCYLLDYQGFSIDKQDNYHIFTLQDAKDGDVLVDGNFIVIFKENNYNPSDKSGCMCVYCSFDMNNDDFYTESGGYNPTYFYPATKVQRALLFQKMHEAGYKWNAERKELKKLSQSEVTKMDDQEQKPAWGEEDERMLNSTIWHLRHSVNNEDIEYSAGQLEY